MNPNHHQHDSILMESSVKPDDALAGFLTQLRALADPGAPEMSPDLQQLAAGTVLDVRSRPAATPLIGLQNAHRGSLRFLSMAAGITVAMGLGVGAAAATSPHFRSATTSVIDAVFGQSSPQSGASHVTPARHNDSPGTRQHVPSSEAAKRSSPAASPSLPGSRASDRSSPSHSFRTAVPSLPSLPAQARIQNPGQPPAVSHKSTHGPVGNSGQSRSGSHRGAAAAHDTGNAHSEAATRATGRAHAKAGPQHASTEGPSLPTDSSE